MTIPKIITAIKKLPPNYRMLYGFEGANWLANLTTDDLFALVEHVGKLEEELGDVEIAHNTPAATELQRDNLAEGSDATPTP